MRAIQFDDYGAPEVLHLADKEPPIPGAGQVQVQVAAIGVNPADTKWRGGMFRAYVPIPLPHVPGYDVAGVISALGADVVGLKVGQRVVATVDAAYAEVTIADASSCAPLPDGFAFSAAAALPCAALTGVQMIEEGIRPKPGQTILVTGATGAVGRFAVHAALESGARVVAAVRPAYVEAARALGADEVVVLGSGETSARPFDHVADTVGGPDVAALCSNVASGGAIVTVATTPIDLASGATPTFFVYHADGQRLTKLVQAVAANAVSMPVAQRLPLASAADAHRLIERGGLNGKIILEP